MPSGWCLPFEYVLVFLFGCALGATELLSRYRDAPLRVLTARASFIYEGLNGLIGVLALVLVHTVASDLVPGTAGTIDHAVYEVLIAGFGARRFSGPQSPGRAWATRTLASDHLSSSRRCLPSPTARSTAGAPRKEHAWSRR